MRLLSLIILSLFIHIDLWSQITYADDIAEIIYTKCASCHRTGEIGPMTLSNYDEVRSWGPTIKEVTAIKYMPPWSPDPSYSRFLGENFLSDDEIAKISQWVDNGMPQGDVASEPPFPDFPNGSILGEPDLVLEMEEAYRHRGNNQDGYRYFVLPSGLTEDKVIKAIEFRPGNKQVVHHALIFEDESGRAAANDAATPEYGFDGFGSFTGGSQDEILDQKQFPGFVPGQKPIFYPDGTGQVLHAGADVVIQMHYAPSPVDEWDQSKINIFFADDTELIDREVQSHIMVPFPDVIDDFFVIAPETIREFHGRWRVPRDISFLSLTPHMHLLGQHWEVFLERPNGDTVNLVRINEWDFNWQGSYSFRKFIKAERGSIVHAIASYDNTSNNPSNPTIPPRVVSWGEKTSDEMYFLPLNYVDYQPGDEDIVFDDGISSVDPEIIIGGDQLYPLYPNPVKDFVVAEFSLAQGKAVNIEILDIEGRVVRQLRSGEFFNMGKNSINFVTSHLEAGIYILNINGDKLNMSQKFVKS